MSSERAANLYKAGDWHDTEIHVHRAGPIGNMHVPTLAIHATTEMPDIPFGEPLAKAREIHVRDAQQIADALIGHLPGGTLDMVLIRLLEHKASYLRAGVDAPFVMATEGR